MSARPRARARQQEALVRRRESHQKVNRAVVVPGTAQPSWTAGANLHMVSVSRNLLRNPLGSSIPTRVRARSRSPVAAMKNVTSNVRPFRLYGTSGGGTALASTQGPWTGAVLAGGVVVQLIRERDGRRESTNWTESTGAGDGCVSFLRPPIF